MPLEPGDGWLVYQTFQMRSDKAVEEITKLGAHAWTPMFSDLVRVHHKRRPQKVVQPMIRSMFFALTGTGDPVAIAQRQRLYRPINFNAAAMVVSDKELNPLRHLEAQRSSRESLPLDCTGKRLSAGDAFEVIEGPFKTFKGTIESWDGSHFQTVINGFGVRFRAAPFLLRRIER